MTKLNAGEIVEHAVRRQNVNISELSRRMKVNRRTLYNWFQQKSLNADVICGIGQVINYDFSKDFNDELHSSALKGSARMFNMKSDRESRNNTETVYYWMEKYIALLEDYKKLLQDSNYQPSFEQRQKQEN
jgi:plasmid maintenance system antidote protein VapI